jgi:hypothetical protein
VLDFFLRTSTKCLGINSARQVVVWHPNNYLIELLEGKDMLMKKLSILLLAAWLIASPLPAGSPDYAFVGFINLAPHATAIRPSSAAADADGGIYFTDNGTDNTYYITDPIAAINTSDINNEVLFIQILGFGGGSSWQGASFDTANDVAYLSGWSSSGPTNQVASVTRTAGNVFTFTQLTGATGTISGMAVAGSNTLVGADYNNGFLQFYSVSGSTISALGSPINGPTPADAANVYTNVFYSTSQNRIFVAEVDNSTTGEVIAFDSDGTPAGTSFTSGDNPIADPSTGSGVGAGAFSYQYAEVEVNDAEQLLVASFNEGNLVDEPAGFKFYDLEEGGTSIAPYLTIDGSQTGGLWDSGQQAQSIAFFSQGPFDYVALGGILPVNSGSNAGGFAIFRQIVPVAGSTTDWVNYE